MGYEGETEHELTEAVRAPTLILPSPQEPTFYRNGELARIMEGNGVANDMVMEQVYEHLREEGIERTGSIGFCWGAWAVAKACQDRSKMQAGVWCHPSLQVGKELYEGETEHELTEAVRAPTLILPSPQEPTFYRNGELACLMEANGVANDMVYFHDQTHGWVVRGAGFLGRSREECGGVNDAGSIIGVQRAVNLALGWYAKRLH